MVFVSGAHRPGEQEQAMTATIQLTRGVYSVAKALDHAANGPLRLQEEGTVGRIEIQEIARESGAPVADVRAIAEAIGLRVKR